jgi:nucleoside-diphosphate-sugar epimerase
MNYNSDIILIGKNGFISRSIGHDLKQKGLNTLVLPAELDEVATALQKMKENSWIILTQGPRRESFVNANFNQSLDRSILDLLINCTSRVILLSSLDVYDFSLNSPWREDGRKTVDNKYGIYKINQENYFKDVTGHSVILRLPTVWGGEFDNSSFIYKMCKDAILRGEIMVDKISNFRSLLHVTSLSRFVYSQFVNGIKLFDGTYNLCDTQRINVLDIANIILERTGCRMLVRSFKSSRPKSMTLDNSKMVGTFGSLDPISLEFEIHKLLERITRESSPY